MKLKKITSLLMIVAMVLSLAACGGSSGNSSDSTSGTDSDSTTESSSDSQTKSESVSTDEMVTVNIAMPYYTDVTDEEQVEAEMNKILAEKYGIQCELTFISIGSWTEQSNLLLTGDEVDAICLYPLSLVTYVNNGQVLDLTDYVANASEEFKSKFTKEQWKGTQVNGKQYAIPNLRNYGNIFVCFFDEEKFNTLGFDLNEIHNLDDVTKVLAAAHEAYPDIYTIVPQSQTTMCNGWTWDGCGDQTYIGVLGNCGQDTTVTDIFECKDFIDFCNYAWSWSQAGYTMADVLSNQNSGTSMIQQGAAFACLSNRACEPTPPGIVQAKLIDGWSDACNITALTYGINALSKHPDEAFQLLEALYCDTDLQNLLINGIEGVHYVVENGQAVYPDGVNSTNSTYGEATMYWTLPYANPDVYVNSELGTANFFKDLVEFNNSLKPSIATGFVLDTDAMGITDEYAACTNVKDKYYDGLMCGVLDPNQYLEIAHQEMVDAGIEKICAAKQKALDELLASKSK